MLTPQSFKDESLTGCQLMTTPSLFGESYRTSDDLSGDQRQSVVPATPDLMSNLNAEKPQKCPQSPFQIMGRIDEWRSEVSEDPLEDFKRRREERRKTQLEFICSKSSPKELSPGRGPAPPGKSEGEKQRSIQRPRKYCSVAVSCKSSLLRMMKPVGLLIPNSKLSSPEGALKVLEGKDLNVPEVGLYVGSLCAKEDTIVTKNVDIGNNLASDHREDSISGKNAPCCAGKDQRAENCSKVEGLEMTDNVKSKLQGLLCQRSSSSVSHPKCNDEDFIPPSAGNASGLGTAGKSHVFQNDKGQCVLGQNMAKETAAEQPEKDNVSTSLKTKRFIVNGEVCYLVPAKLFVNKMQKTIKDQLPTKIGLSFAGLSESLQEKKSSTLTTDNISASGSQRENGQGGSHQSQNHGQVCIRRDPKLKVSSFVHMRSQLHVQKGCHWLIDVPIVPQCLSAPKSTSEQVDKVVGYKRRVFTRLHQHGTSTSNMKHSCLARSCLHISRLHKSTGDSKCIGQIKGQGQISQESSSVDGMESKVDGASGCNRKNSSKDLMLQFVINASRAGTFIFADEKSFEDIDEPPLWINIYNDKKRTAADQIVPHLTRNQENISKSQSDDIERKNSEQADDEMGSVLQEIKSLIGVSFDVDKLNLINRACDFIRDLELRIRVVLKVMGCDDSVAHVLLGGNYYKDTSNGALKYKTTPRISKRKRSSEFLVPQSGNSIEKTRKESPVTGRFKPSSVDRLTSPALTIGGSGWDGAENQVYVPPQSRSALPLSSQLSFSESLTDDSENVNEFDLLFENSPSRNNERKPNQCCTSGRKHNGSTFHAYVNEILDEIFEDDFDPCGKATPKKTQDQSSRVDFSTPSDHITSPSWYDFRSSPSEKASHCGDTPQSFSVHSLDYDACDEVKRSPKWYHTVEQDTHNAYDAARVYHGSLSMKVIENDSRCDDVQKNGSTPERHKSNSISNSYEELDKKITEVEDGEDKFTSYLKELIDKESRCLHEDEDAAALKILEDVAMRKEQDELLPPVSNTIILARDLLKSDLLASFLFPRPRFIPEDPFGIGAETVIEKTTSTASQDGDENDSTWQNNIEVTPPQSKRGLLSTPPKVCKSKGPKRRGSQEADGRPTRTRHRQKTDLIELRESPLSAQSDEETTCQDFVFLPEIEKLRGQSHNQKRQPSIIKRKRKNSEDVSFFASTCKMPTTCKKKNAETSKKSRRICRDIRVMKTRAPLHRRQALNSIN